MTQLHLFATVIAHAELKADSKRNAFYRIRVEECQGNYKIIKESGINEKILDRREWSMPSHDAAIKKFERIVGDKTNKNRNSPRKYVQQGIKRKNR